jgi:hypothetical protein
MKDFRDIQSTYKENAYIHSVMMYPSAKELLNYIKSVYGLPYKTTIRNAIYYYYQSLKATNTGTDNKSVE